MGRKKEINKKTEIISIREESQKVERTKQCAKLVGMSYSAYLRVAVSAYNDNVEKLMGKIPFSPEKNN